MISGETESVDSGRPWLRVKVVAGAAVLLSGVATFVAEIWAMTVISTPYDAVQQAVSDLGVTQCRPLETYNPPIDVCSPAHDLINFTWIVTGIVIAFGVWFLRPRRGGALGIVGTSLIAVAGFMQTAVGLFPADSDLNMHLLTALTGFMTQTFGMVFFGLSYRRNQVTRRYGGLVLILGLIMAIGGVFLIVSTVSGGMVPLGVAERIVIYPFQLWMVCAGIREIRVRQVQHDI